MVTITFTKFLIEFLYFIIEGVAFTGCVMMTSTREENSRAEAIWLLITIIVLFGGCALIALTMINK